MQSTTESPQPPAITYMACDRDHLPPYLRWHTPPRNQGQIVETSFANADPLIKSVACHGDEYQRVIDHSDGATRYSRRSDVAAIRWVTWGSVRGDGPVRRTQSEAVGDLKADRAGCQRQGGYSDRRVFVVDHEGYVCDPESGYPVYPHGRGNGALRV